MKRLALTRVWLLLAMLAVIFSWTPHQQASAVVVDTATLALGLRVDQRCLVLALPLDFGTYDILNPSPTDGTGSITIDCTNVGRNNSMRVRIGQGQFPAAGSTAGTPRRQMSNGGAGRVRYDLYQDAARTDVWGDTNATAMFPGEGPYPATFPVYGRIPALQSGLVALPGSYNDVAVVTLQF
jgi:spore coat protein U-like protein